MVGTVGYFANIGVFAGLHEIPLDYVVASILAYFISNALMYVGNRYLTFRLGHDGFWGRTPVTWSSEGSWPV
jgi:putative flippase GtrA